tara:strand:- start:373 stop:537 length:165 start_codon:yes stop_codon:yes gene_type:complete
MKVALSKYLGRRLTSKTGITLGIAWMGERNLPHPPVYPKEVAYKKRSIPIAFSW